MIRLFCWYCSLGSLRIRSDSINFAFISSASTGFTSTRSTSESAIDHAVPRPACSVTIAKVVFLFLVTLPSISNGELQKMSPEAAVEAAGEGLRREASFPWYDAEKDDLRPLTLREKAAPADAKEWEARRKKKKTAKQNWNFNWNFLEGLSLFMQIAAYGFLIALLLLAIYFVMKSTAIQEMFVGSNSKEEEDVFTDEQRVENLPFEVRRPRANLLAEARRLYELGKFGEALVYLFSYQLLQLDKNHWIRLRKGKTNRQYLQEIRHRQELRGILQTTMIPFEDFFFGHYQIERERFESCWGRLDEFHQLGKAEGAS